MNFFKVFSRKKGKNNLEKIVDADSGIQSDIVGSDLFNKVNIVEEFSNVDFSAKKLWSYFNEKGKVKGIHKKGVLSLENEKKPQVKNSEDGSFYPINIKFSLEIDKKNYIVDFEMIYSDKLRVTIECDSADIKYMRDILRMARYEPISITKNYDHKESVRLLYEYLKEKSESMKIESRRGENVPKMVVDDHGGLLPVNARLHAVIDSKDYIIEINNFMNYSVSVECSPENLDFINTLLNDISDLGKRGSDAEGSKHVKTLEFSIPVKEYTWDMIGGLGDVRKELDQYIQGPMANPALFNALDLKMPKGILFVGPPGTGKTTIAKIIANSTDSSFYSISPKDMNSKWVGETEKNWSRLFNQARMDAQQGKTAIIFIDEIDGFYTSREEMDKYTRISFGQFCQEMDGISDLEGVVVIAATNNYDMLDPALVRPGRFSKKIYIGNPDLESRKSILNIYIGRKPVDGIDKDLIAQRTEGYSGAMLKELCDSASFNAIERYCKDKKISIKDIKGEMIKEVVLCQWDFEKAINYIKKSFNGQNRDTK